MKSMQGLPGEDGGGPKLRAGHGRGGTRGGRLVLGLCQVNGGEGSACPPLRRILSQTAQAAVTNSHRLGASNSSLSSGGWEFQDQVPAGFGFW